MVGEEVIVIKVELKNRIFGDEIHNNTESYQFWMNLSQETSDIFDILSFVTITSLSSQANVI